MKFAKLMDGLDRNIFSVLDDKKIELLNAGREVINLSVGTPDFKPDAHVMEELQKRAADPDNFKYSLSDMPLLSKTVAAWYARRYGVELDVGEIASCNGSQDGIGHAALALINPGDKVLVPDPGYPIFSFGALMAGAVLEYTPLLAENGFLIDFDAIPPSVAHDAKLLVASYPSNPVTALADDEFYDKMVFFAKKYDVFVLHDNAYSELVYDGKHGTSFLKAKGAKEVGIEFNSLSKSYNLTGMRCSFALGNRQMVDCFRRLRSQIDYGMFYPIQYAAIAALTGSQDILERNRSGYQARRDALCGGFRSVGWDVPDSPATMFVWAKIPDGFKDSFDFTYELMDKTGVIGTPGSAFGPRGEGYIRFALVREPEVMKKAAKNIKSSGILNR